MPGFGSAGETTRMHYAMGITGEIFAVFPDAVACEEAMSAYPTTSGPPALAAT